MQTSLKILAKPSAASSALTGMQEQTTAAATANAPNLISAFPPDSVLAILLKSTGRENVKSIFLEYLKLRLVWQIWRRSLRHRRSERQCVDRSAAGAGARTKISDGPAAAIGVPAFTGAVRRRDAWFGLDWHGP